MSAFPSIAASQDGSFTVSWNASGEGGTASNIYGQSFTSAGDSKGTSFIINSTTTGDQEASDIEFAENGDLISTWISNGQDGDGNGIFAQRWSTGSSSSSTGSSSSSSSSTSSSSGPTLDSPSNAMAAITAIDTAIKTVNVQRSKLGAVSNRLSHTVNNLTNISSNLSAAQGGIEDADFAKETTALAKNQILQQASTAMLAQANASKQNVLSLLQG